MIDMNTDDWVQICAVKNNEICFTAQYLHLTEGLPGGARKFAAHLITYWDKDLGRVLDYFGPAEAEKDWYSGIDGEPMDVGELYAETSECRGLAVAGLNSEWYRDLMRAKLITLKLPRKLIEDYGLAIKNQEN